MSQVSRVEGLALARMEIHTVGRSPLGCLLTVNSIASAAMGGLLSTAAASAVGV